MLNKADRAPMRFEWTGRMFDSSQGCLILRHGDLWFAKRHWGTGDGWWVPWDEVTELTIYRRRDPWSSGVEVVMTGGRAALLQCRLDDRFEQVLDDLGAVIIDTAA